MQIKTSFINFIFFEKGALCGMRSCPWDSLSNKALKAVLDNLENLVERIEINPDHLLHTQFQVAEAPDKIDTYSIVSCWNKFY